VETDPTHGASRLNRVVTDEGGSLPTHKLPPKGASNTFQYIMNPSRPTSYMGGQDSDKKRAAPKSPFAFNNHTKKTSHIMFFTNEGSAGGNAPDFSKTRQRTDSIRVS
jgi:hypothetical protein